MVEISKAYDMKNILIAFLVYAYVIIFTKTLKYRLKFSIFGVMDNTIMVNDIYSLVLEPSYCKGAERLPSLPILWVGAGNIHANYIWILV
jgi:hypothetical protein